MIDWLKELMTLGYWTNMLDQIREIGIFAGVGLAMIEAFFPPLPLILFVTINVTAFGFWTGYMYSWLGSCIGSIIVFLVIKRFGQKRFQQKIAHNEKIFNIFRWIKEKGFTPVFFLHTFPFTPSIVVCGLAALAGIKNREYISGLVLGKLLMIFSLSFIGFNVRAFVEQPLKSIILISATLAISLIGKKIIKICEKKFEKKEQAKNKKLPVKAA
ncbi:TVP38/TMEM64 family protein [Vallitalea longa]|uniref:TVP38/TMEM64 family membrane protein n=1 Tax=Vallitalea longa TaxID=2936439 RepID=A0A9W5YDJ4_9FIRM|nr:VTT domain-containing protein [Vallitalea longa]GKX30656.1 TVP38/TMEM64 family protein [Vallitalea longa]